MAGIEACPVSHPFVGAKRRLARSVQPKEPLSVSTVQAIATLFFDLRFSFILLVYAGFFSH